MRPPIRFAMPATLVLIVKSAVMVAVVVAVVGLLGLAR